jgi:hypothetical protein
LLEVNPDPVFVTERLQSLLGLGGDPLATDGENFVHAVIAHDLPHRGLGHVPECLVHVPDVEKVVVGVLDLVLNDPFHQRHVEVSGQHQGLVQVLASFAILGAHPGLKRAESELGLELTLDRHLANPLGEGDLEMKPGARLPDVGAETLHNPRFIGLHLIKAGEEQNEHYDPNHHGPDGGR